MHDANHSEDENRRYTSDRTESSSSVDQKDAHRVLRKRSAQLKSVPNAFRTLLQADPEMDLPAKAIEAVARILNCDVTIFARFHKKTLRVVCLHTVGKTEFPELILTDSERMIDCIQRKQGIFLANLPDDAAIVDRHLRELFNIKAMIAAAVEDDSETGIYGCILALQVYRRRSWDHRDIELLRMISETCGHRIAKEQKSEISRIVDQRLRSMKEGWMRAFEFLAEPAIILDPELRIIHANRRFLQYAKQDRRDVLGEHCSDFFRCITESGESTPQCALNVAGEHKTCEPIEAVMEGFGRTFLVSCTPVFDSEGNLEQILHVGVDISERRRAEHEIVSLARFPEENPDPVLRVLRDGTLIYANPASEELLHQWERKVGQKLPDALASTVQEAFGSDHQFKLETRSNGHIYWMTVAPVTEQGYVNVYGRDITEYKRAAEALQESREKFRTLTESVSDWIWETDADGEFIYSSPRVKDILDVKTEEVIGRTPYDFMKDEQYKAAKQKFMEVREHREPLLLFEHEFVKPSGETVILETSAVPRFDSDDGLKGYYGITHDITQRKQNERALRESEERYRKLIETMNDGVAVLDREGKFQFVNDRLCEIIGYSRSEILGKVVPDFLDDENAMIWREQLKLRKQGRPGYFELVWKSKDGTELTMFMSARPVMKADEFSGVFMVMTDITERKRLEEQFRQAQKLEAVGRLAGGIAHDFNNQLTVIQGYCDLLLRMISDEDASFGPLQEIRKASQRATTLTSQLLSFSRKQVLRPKRVDLNELIHDLADPLSRLIGEHIRLNIVPDDHLGRVEADPALVQQVIMNLALNARDAMRGGGKLTIETENVELAPRDLPRNSDVSPGAYVMVTVTDTGGGVDPEMVPYIFEPFYTSKPIGKGTGLGLAMVHGFVKQSGGHVTLENHPGRGATFRVYLPRVKEQQIPKKAEKTHTTTFIGGTETILVAEDDDHVRLLIVRVLRDGGYTVLESSGGADAIPLGEHYEGDIQLLVSDVVMPDMSGPEIAERLKAKRPDMKVLFVTGYAEHPMGKRQLDHEAKVLTKPFSPEQLAKTVRDILNDE